MMKNRSESKISEKQCIEICILICAALIIAGLFTDQRIYYILTLVLLTSAIIVPVIYYPFAFLWFGLSKKAGILTSWILLGLIFYLIVTPVALIFKLAGRDFLKIKKFKKNHVSVFIVRAHKYVSSDLLHVY
jgi:hypothetical protein